MITIIKAPTPIEIINDNYKDLPSKGNAPKKDRRVGRRLMHYPHLDVDLESIDRTKRLVATYNLVNKDGIETPYRRFSRFIPNNGPCYWKEDNVPFVILEEVEQNAVIFTLFQEDGSTIPTKATLTF